MYQTPPKEIQNPSLPNSFRNLAANEMVRKLMLKGQKKKKYHNNSYHNSTLVCMLQFFFHEHLRVNHNGCTLSELTMNRVIY